MGLFDRWKRRREPIPDLKGADGTRWAMKTSYQQHVNHAPRDLVKSVGSAHLAGLFGALATRYISAGASHQVVEQRAATIWLELLPFLHLRESVSAEALAEYVVWKEAETRSEARLEWLETQIAEGLDRARAAGKDEQVDLVLADKEGIRPVCQWVAFV